MAQEKARELLKPILGVFGGEDGGVAFTKLLYEFMPHILESKTQNAAEMTEIITKFSRLCKVLLEEK